MSWSYVYFFIDVVVCWTSDVVVCVLIKILASYYIPVRGSNSGTLSVSHCSDPNSNFGITVFGVGSYGK